MPKSKTLYIDFSRALPKGEPLAGLMGRMFVILADLEIERKEFGRHSDGEYEKLSEDEKHYRLLYTVRASSRTLYAGQKLFSAFDADAQFREWLAADQELREKWREATREVNKARSLIESVRNSIGAHTEESIDETIKIIDGADGVKLELVPDGTGLRTYSIANVILAAALAPRKSTEEWFRDANERATKLAGTFKPMVTAMWVAFELYRKRYPAIWPI